MQTVASLLLTNSDFRLFLSDLQSVGRQVFKDSAFALSKVAEDAGNKVSVEDVKTTDAGKAPPLDKPNGENGENVGNGENGETGVAEAVGDGLVAVTQEATNSLQENLSGEEGDIIIERLKKAVLNLRRRPDYSESVSTLSKIFKRYMLIYSRALEDVVETAQEDIEQNSEADAALTNLWSLASSFGDQKEWEELKKRFGKVVEHHESDPDFESLVSKLADSIQELLTDPDFFQNVDEKFQELRANAEKVGSESPLRQDLNALLEQTQVVISSVIHDEDVRKLLTTSLRLASILSPAHAVTNTDLVKDSVNVFMPLLISAIQHVPIPRLEISAPEIDLLLENLIIEPGRTVNHTSFLPFRLRFETYNDVEIRKARRRTVSTMKSLVTIKLDGLSARAEEVGFWLRAHSGIFRLADEGIASFELDERGMDVHLDVELGADRLEHMLSLRAVRVKIHKLSYTLRKSKFSWIAWLLKPIMRPILRKVMEKQIASAIEDACHNANRELLFARERLRATRISDPRDVRTFFRAVMARLQPEEDPELYTRVGVAQPGKGVFQGVYAPGSVVKVWNEEAAEAGERIEEYDQGGWRNEIFDTNTTTT